MKVALGLGSNLGNRLETLRTAIDELDCCLQLESVSRIYESEALNAEGAAAQDPDFLNLVVLGQTPLTLRELLGRAKAIEEKLGRRSTRRWAPRPIDIDLLAASTPYSDPVLTVPHPELVKRPFALLPLAEVWPDWIFPTGPLAGKSAVEAAAALDWSDERRRPLKTRRTPLIMSRLVGVLNITPDSFSDGGEFLDPDRAVARARALLDAGASILDIGAESTRPGASLMTAAEEWARLEPVLRKLNALGATLSVDTRHPETARRALESGAAIINDVSGFENTKLVEAVRDSRAKLVFMHSLGVPPSVGKVIEGDPIEEVLAWGTQRAAELEAQGISRERLIFDPGIGFGKTRQQQLEIIARANELHRLGLPILIGHSRKSFMADFTGRPAADRDLETAVLSAALAHQGIQYLRIHDIESTARAIRARVSASDFLFNRK